MTQSHRRPKWLAAACALGAAAVLSWGTARFTDRTLWFSPTRPDASFHVLRIAMLLGVLALAVVGTALGPLRANRLAVRRGALATLAAAAALLGLELTFMFVARSHNVGYTLAAGVWWDRHWGPENSLGYRDGEHVRVPGKQLVFAVGDSFTAGAGIERAQRFADLLQASRPDLHVCNLGRNGADTAAEFAALTSHPLQPDAIVLQYYPNDIDGVAVHLGLQPPEHRPHEDLPPLGVRFAVRSSYLLNYVYWLFGHVDVQAFLAYRQRVLGDERVVQQHLQQLMCFADFAAERRIPLTVVVFPRLRSPELSAPLTERVVAAFTARGAQVVDVQRLVADLPADERVVNAHDEHASPVVHERVARALAQLLAAH